MPFISSSGLNTESSIITNSSNTSTRTTRPKSSSTSLRTSSKLLGKAATTSDSATTMSNSVFIATNGGVVGDGDNVTIPDSTLSKSGNVVGAKPSRQFTPLRRPWVFWFRQQRAPGNKITNYEEGIKRVATFNSVESFWSLYTHLNPPSTLVPTTDYLLFHDQVRRPVWEDPLNEKGGKWIIRLRKGLADRLWEDLMMAVVGDQFDEQDGICGCVLSVRGNEDILSIWNKDDKDLDAKGRIRDVIRRALSLPPSCIMEYKSNNDSIHDKSSFRTHSYSGSALNTPVTPV